MDKFTSKPEINWHRIYNVAVIAPHPDDELLGCGGTIKALKEQKKKVHVLFITRGEKGGDPEIRISEAKKVQDILKYDYMHVWNFPDGEVKNYKKILEERLRSFFKEKEIQLAIFPAPYDLHADHRTIGEICFNIHRDTKYMYFSLYSIYNYVFGNTYVKVDNWKEDLNYALTLYKHSLGNKINFFIKSFNFFREWSSIISGFGNFTETLYTIPREYTLKDVIRDVMGDLFSRDFRFYLLHELKTTENIIGYTAFLEEEMSKLKREKEELHNYILSLIKTCEEYRKEKEKLLNELRKWERSRFYKLSKIYRKIIDTAFPLGSRRRKFYDIIIGRR